MHLPTLDRSIVRDHLGELASTAVPKWRLRYVTTGGTTGAPLRFYSDRREAIREQAFIARIWERVDYRFGDGRITVRGAALAGVRSHRPWEFNPATPGFVLSAYHLNEDVIGRFAAAIRDYPAVALHAYPSTANILAHFVLDHPNVFPKVRAVLLGSELLLPTQREIITEAFPNARVLSWYGHSEGCVLASECECSDGFHVQDEYGLVELLDPSGQQITVPGIRGEITGTRFWGIATGFLRYRTGDFAEWKYGECACGRASRRLEKVEPPAWRQATIIGRSGNAVSMTAMNFHSRVFDSVLGYQYVQHEQGRVEVRFIPKERFTDSDLRLIRDEVLSKLKDSFDVTFVPVRELQSSPRGKMRMVVQDLDVQSFHGPREGRDVQRES